MSIVINKTIRYGLEIHQCYVNGTLVTEFMSARAARDWANRMFNKLEKMNAV